jgi:seryl-tRNA synthetase
MTKTKTSAQWLHIGFDDSQDEIERLIEDLADVKKSLKELQEQETELKEQLLQLMTESGIDARDCDYGSVRIQRRQEKDYGPEIKNLELQYKEAKKIADDLGDFSILATKESIVFSPPKDS